MRIINIVTLVQIISWAVFILEDFLAETTSYGGDSGSALVSVFVLPVLVSALYLILKKKVFYSSIPGWANALTALFIWITENIILTAVISYLMSRDRWFIHQATDGWGNLLNGLEYGLFPLFNIVIPPVIAAAWNLIKRICR